MIYWSEKVHRQAQARTRLKTGWNRPNPVATTGYQCGLHVESQPIDTQSTRILQSVIDRLKHAHCHTVLTGSTPPVEQTEEAAMVCQTRNSTSLATDAHRPTTTSLTEVQ